MPEPVPDMFWRNARVPQARQHDRLLDAVSGETDLPGDGAGMMQFEDREAQVWVADTQNALDGVYKLQDQRPTRSLKREEVGEFLRRDFRCRDNRRLIRSPYVENPNLSDAQRRGSALVFTAVFAESYPAEAEEYALWSVMVSEEESRDLLASNRLGMHSESSAYLENIKAVPSPAEIPGDVWVCTTGYQDVPHEDETSGA